MQEISGPVDYRALGDRDKQIPIDFTKAEFWLLNDFIRHDVDLELNEEIALGIDACENSKFELYTLLLTQHQLLMIEYWVRREYKTPEGASGKTILIKVCNARARLQGLESVSLPGTDKKYNVEAQKQNAHPDTNNQPDYNPD